MDELDEQIMDIVRKKGKSNLGDIVDALAKDYNLNIIRAKVRRHSDSLTRYGFLKKSLIKRHSRRSSTYAYEVNDQ